MMKSAILFLALFFIFGCNESKPLKVAYHSWPGYMPLCIANNEKLMDQKLVQLVKTFAATDSIDLLKSGEVQGAALTLDEVLRVNTEGLDLVVVLVFDVSAGADKVIVKPHIRSLKDLKGKKIAVEYGALGALILNKILESAGLTESDIEIIQKPVDEYLKIWDKVDAAIIYPPISDDLIKKGGSEIFSSREMPDMIFDVLAIKRSVLSTYHKQISNLVRGHFKAIRILQNNQYNFFYKTANCMETSVERVKNDFKELVIPNLNLNYAYLSQERQKIRPALALLKKEMIKWKLIKDVAINQTVTSEFLPVK